MTDSMAAIPAETRVGDGQCSGAGELPGLHALKVGPLHRSGGGHRVVHLGVQGDHKVAFNHGLKRMAFGMVPCFEQTT